jgi:hypothetical protein
MKLLLIMLWSVLTIGMTSPRFIAWHIRIRNEFNYSVTHIDYFRERALGAEERGRQISMWLRPLAILLSGVMLLGYFIWPA